MNTSIIFALASMLVAASCMQNAAASSEAGLDIPLQSARVRVVYSVAFDYDKNAESCIHDPSCLLFDLIGYLQTNEESLPSSREVLQFELYQSLEKEGNRLAFVRDPYEGGRYLKLFDGRAELDLVHQIVELLGKSLKISSSEQRRHKSIELYKCLSKTDCHEILFGSFPSEGMRSGYCASPGKGCEAIPITVERKEMTKYFSPIEE